jgi:hypothetical protein
MYTPSCRVGQRETKSGKLTRIAECLNRLSTTGMYYAVIRHDGKLYRRSLETRTSPRDQRPKSHTEIGKKARVLSPDPVKDR